MALREQPYLPLYVQDFLSDEKLNECSAESTGVYIRLMCIMHKSQEYGKITLKQKDKQNTDQIQNFAFKLVRQMPYSAETIADALTELLEERVLSLEGDSLFQKRMVKDGEMSEKRALAGSKGGKIIKGSRSDTPEKKQNGNKTASKQEANSENEIDIENDNKRERDSTERERGKVDSFRAYAGDDTVLLEALKGYEEMRKKLKKPMTEHAKKLLLKELDKLAEPFRERRRYCLECLEEATLKGWQSVYALKDFEDGPEWPPGSQERLPDSPVEFEPGKSWEECVP